MRQPKQVRSFNSRAEADVAATLLSASGIKSVVVGGEPYPNSPCSLAHITVDASDIEVATALIAKYAENNNANPIPLGPMPPGLRRFLRVVQLLWFSQLLVLIFVVGNVEVRSTLSEEVTVSLWSLNIFTYLATISFVGVKRSSERYRRMQNMD